MKNLNNLWYVHIHSFDHTFFNLPEIIGQMDVSNSILIVYSYIHQRWPIAALRVLFVLSFVVYKLRTSAWLQRPHGEMRSSLSLASIRMIHTENDTDARMQGFMAH